MSPSSLKPLMTLALAALCAAGRAADAAPPCLGQLTALAVQGDQLYVGAQAGLFQWTLQGLRRVKGAPKAPILHLQAGPQGLLVTLGDGEKLALPWGGGSPVPDLLPSPSLIPAPFEFEASAPVTARAFWRGQTCTATLGSGVLMNGQALPGGPAQVLALKAWKGGLALVSPDTLWSFDGTAWHALWKNASPDCRITAIVEHQGLLYAGTLNGGMLRLPSHCPVGGGRVLDQRVNAFCSRADGLFVATDGGLLRWDGATLSPQPLICSRPVAAIFGQGSSLTLCTNRGLVLHDLPTHADQRLSKDRGLFAANYQGATYFGGMYGAQCYQGPGRQRLVLAAYTTGFAQLEGKLYASTYYDGLWDLSGPEPLKVAEGAYTCMTATDRGLALGSGDGRLALFLPSTKELLPLDPSALPVDCVSTLAWTHQGLYAGTPVGAAKIDPPQGVMF